MPYTFVCDACELTLDDGVDYTWCPACGGALRKPPRFVCESCEATLDEVAEWCSACGGKVREIRARRPATRAVSLDAMVRWLLGAALVVQAVLAVLAPDAFPYLGTWLVIAQLASVIVVLLALALAREVRALARDKRTRILHGLEHATINLLLPRGFPVRSGCTYDGEFEIRLDHDGRSWDRLVEIRDAARDAIVRISRGESALAYSPLCGTSWLVGYCLLALAVVTSGAVALLLGAPVGITFAATVAAGFAARAIKRPLGLWVQRHLTVSTDLLVATVKEVERRASADGNTMIVTIAIDVTPKHRATRGGTVIPLFG